MSATATEDSGAGRSSEGALVEWRSSDQVENGTPSTSPPYWDSYDDDDGGPKPSELYGKYTWKIDKFSEINKRELRSNAFDVGGYKWYILIYPQGCDVCNHLSLFLCVANHDKLLPGWSHFAQFTIAVVNKDPKKSKYSDTLHRFWKKEHDWGWKKFMELSKVLEGFIDSDTLIINAQVQVLRERADRPFRCLDCQYRRELVRVYLTNVEQICRRFVEEHRGKFGKLIEDKARWSSFCGFWLTMDQNSRRHMSREKTEGLLKVVVKHFFIEKEVTSTLVMDSLYSGLKAVEGQYKGKKSKGKYVEAEEFPVPIVRMEKDMFVLVDDVLPLLERAAVEPLPPKDEKGPQNRTKDGTLGEEFNRDSIERDERRLTELGRRTIEIFILAHVFSKIEVAYQEAVALKKQEELIREEEAAWLAEIEHRARRGAADKEKKSKKKQGKNKRNNNKNKDKGKDDKAVGIAQEKTEQHIRTVNRKDSLAAESAMVLEESDPVDDVSDISEIVPPDSEDRDMNPVNWDTDNSEVHPPTEASGSEVSGLSSAQNGTEGRSSVIVDDSSSTCSSDSVRLVAISVPQIGNSRCKKNKKSLNRGRKHQNEATPDLADLDGEKPGQPSKAVESPSQAAHQFFQGRVVNGAELLAAKDEKANSLRTAPPKSDLKVDFPIELIVKKPSSGRPRQADRSVNRLNSAENARKFATQKPTEKLPTQPQVTTDEPSAPSMSVMSRPSSAPLFPGPMPPISVAPTVPKKPVLAHSVSAVGRLGPEINASDGLSYVPQSYRNAILGAAVVRGLNCSASSVVNASCSYSQAPAPISSMLSPYAFDRMEPRQIGPSFSFGISNQWDTLPNGPLWETNLNLRSGCASLHNGLQSFDLYGSVPAFGRQSHGLPDEFPHLDIINDLLNDEHGGDQGFNNGPHYLNRHFSFPGDPSRFGPATSTCRFERARGYQDDVFQHPYVPLREMIPSAGLGSYADGPIDGLIPNQWGMAGSDLPFHMRNTDNDGYPYHIPEYRNLTGHTVFRPSDGV